MRMFICSAVLLGAVAAPAFASTPCAGSSAPTVASMRLSQPLVAVAGADSDLRITAREDGCISVHYPAWDTRAGDYSYRVGNAELADLRAELLATGVARFEPKQVREDLALRSRAKQAADPRAIRYAVTDDAVIELQISTGPKSAANLTWTGLRGQLLNHPDQEALIGLSVARDRMLELASDRRMIKVGQP